MRCLNKNFRKNLISERISLRKKISEDILKEITGAFVVVFFGKIPEGIHEEILGEIPRRIARGIPAETSSGLSGDFCSKIPSGIYRESHQAFMKVFVEKYLNKSSWNTSTNSCWDSTKKSCGNALKVSPKILMHILSLIPPRITPEIH